MLAVLLIAAGHSVALEVHATGAGVLFPGVIYAAGTEAPCAGPDGKAIKVGAEITGQGAGGGGGGGGRVSYAYTTEPRGLVFGGFRLGTGVDVIGLYQSVPSGLVCTVAGTTTNVEIAFARGPAYFVTVPLVISGVLGVGAFALTLAYAPSLTISSGAVALNYAGVELGIELFKRFRATFHFLPPIGTLPLYGSVSIGAIWY